MYIDGDMIVVSIRAHQYKTTVTYHDDTIVVSIRAHQYKLAMRTQVLHIKHRSQQYKLALQQSAIIVKQASHKEAEVFVAVVERWRGGWDRGWWGI
jgi:hypothetical protein